MQELPLHSTHTSSSESSAMVDDDGHCLSIAGSCKLKLGCAVLQLIAQFDHAVCRWDMLTDTHAMM